jgi:uncharacterized protein YbjT (DUF2867 family)
MTVLAITGGTGFVGSHLIDHALFEDYRVRALTRRPQAAREGVTWVEGSLETPAALAELVRGADAVIHVAGVVNAPGRAGFVAGNVAGTRAMVEVAKAAGVRRFIQVSSIAAREPDLSAYGWSKAEADKVVRASGLDWTLVRPPAIFGPRDSELLELFRLAKRGLVPLPPAGNRMSVIAVGDLARLLLLLGTSDALIGGTVEPDDGEPGGWDQRAFARAIGAAVSRRVRPLPLPRALLDTVARADRLVRGAKAKLTPDRVAYFCHRDWTAHDRPPADLWQPVEPTPHALAETARWYRQRGLL